MIYNYLMTLILFTLVVKCQPGKSDRGCGSGWHLWRLHNCPLQICSAFLFLLKIQDLSQIEKHRRWCQFQNKLGVTPKQLKKRARAISVCLHLIYRCETSWLTERFQENSCVSEAGVICAGVSSHFYFLSHTATAGEAVKRAVIFPTHRWHRAVVIGSDFLWSSRLSFWHGKDNITGSVLHEEEVEIIRPHKHSDTVSDKQLISGL